ncbi:MAG: cytochrome c [Sandaracinaceae bacterium]
MWRTRSLVAFASLSMLACGAAEGEPARAEHAHHAGGGDHHHGAADHGGHGHDHSSPAALRPLMRDLFAKMGELRGALESGEVNEAATHARAIAVACDDQDVHHVDPQQFGPRFAEIDQQLHGAAAEMAAVAEAGDLEAARARYGDLHAACVACHAQAPTAQRVDLSAIAGR